jgi:hypothetical protein
MISNHRIRGICQSLSTHLLKRPNTNTSLLEIAWRKEVLPRILLERHLPVAENRK